MKCFSYPFELRNMTLWHFFQCNKSFLVMFYYIAQKSILLHYQLFHFNLILKWEHIFLLMVNSIWILLITFEKILLRSKTRNRIDNCTYFILFVNDLLLFLDQHKPDQVSNHLQGYCYNYHTDHTSYLDNLVELLLLLFQIHPSWRWHQL